MSNSSDKHTPGPWFANTTGTTTVAMVWAQADAGDIHAAPIAECADFEERRPRAEAQANARLVAAAPDLLAIVRAISEAAFGPDGEQIPVTLDEEMQDDICTVLSYVEGLI